MSDGREEFTSTAIRINMEDIADNHTEKEIDVMSAKIGIFALVALADLKIKTSEVEYIYETFHKKHKIEKEQVKKMIDLCVALIKEDPNFKNQSECFIDVLADHLDTTDRLQFFKACFVLCRIDLDIDRRELTFLKHLADRLGINEDVYLQTKNSAEDELMGHKIEVEGLKLYKPGEYKWRRHA